MEILIYENEKHVATKTVSRQPNHPRIRKHTRRVEQRHHQSPILSRIVLSSLKIANSGVTDKAWETMQVECESTEWKSLPVDALWWKGAAVCQATKDLLPLKIIAASAFSFLIAWIKIFSLQKNLQSITVTSVHKAGWMQDVSASKIYNVYICCICFFS